MSLPFRAGRSGERERVVSVDGAWGAPGLNLSHWPGNVTPADLVHPLATGIALNYARLAPARRAELSEGCVAVSNNHFDVDGLCSVWTVQHPELALTLEHELLAAATCGDLYRVTDDAALGFEAAAMSLSCGARFEGLSEHEATALAYELALPHVEALARGRFEGELAEPARTAIERFDSQRALAVACLAHEDSQTRLARFELTQDQKPLDRRALFSTTDLETALTISQSPEGLRAWLVLNTEWFFDYQAHPLGTKPDLDDLASRLNRLEGTRPSDRLAWRAVAATGATPQLYFGRDGQEQFVENNAHLAWSSLSLDALTEELERAFRRARETTA